MPKLKDVMTKDPITLPATAFAWDAARLMKEQGIGDVIIERDGRVCGIVTDRDLVVRGIAEGRDPSATKLGDLASPDLVTLSPDDDVTKAVEVMRSKALRRLPVTAADGEAVGVVSIGDLAMDRDPDSALANISAAPPND